eukprot:831435-Prymnesium_polylepis.1
MLSGSKGGGKSGLETVLQECSPLLATTRIAFVFAGQARTFVHPAAHTSLLRLGVKAFAAGAKYDTFFYLTDDDLGTSGRHAPIGDDEDAVRRAISIFEPQRVYYGPFTKSSPPTPSCELSSRMRSKYKYSESPVWHMWWATWEKVRRGYMLVKEHEAAQQFRYTWVVRMRVDVYFFGMAPAHCSLRAGQLAIPAGVVGCCYPRVQPRTPHEFNPKLTETCDTVCANDHMAFVPREFSDDYFELSRDIQLCSDAGAASGKHFENFTDDGGRYLWWRMVSKGVQMGPSPVVPYTLLRNCRKVISRST